MLILDVIAPLALCLPDDILDELISDLENAQIEASAPIPCPEAPDYLLASATYTGWSFDTAEIDTGLAA